MPFALCDVISVVTEFIVRALQLTHLSSEHVGDASSVWAEFIVSTGKRGEHPRGMPLVTRLLASSEHAWETNGILECKFLSENAHRAGAELYVVRNPLLLAPCSSCTTIVVEPCGKLGDGASTVMLALCHPLVPIPSVFGRNLQCELVREVDTREECHRSHACSLQANMRGNRWHPRM
jgi:hypothetical protein